LNHISGIGDAFMQQFYVLLANSGVSPRNARDDILYRYRGRMFVCLNDSSILL